MQLLAAIAYALFAVLAYQSDVPQHDGIWKSAGNAELLVLDANGYKNYDLTAISCVESSSGKRDEVYKLYPAIDSWTEDKLVVSGYDFRYTLDRIAALPESCTKKTVPDDPFYNFDVFWQYFQENYISFAGRHIDWKHIRSAYRPRIHSTMSQKELYTVLGEIVETINDPHVFISNGESGDKNLSFASPDPHGIAAAARITSPGKTTATYRKAASDIVNALETSIRYELLHGNYQAAHNDRLTWGLLTRDVGYLRISEASGFFKPGTPRTQMYSELDSTLDRVFLDLRGAKALIIDDTTNTGGATFIPDAIARRVILKPGVAYENRVRNGEVYTEPFVKTLEPVSGRPRFDGRVILLVSSNTVSAGEHLAIVLRGLPNVTVYGSQTLGATSSILVKHLPNGGIVGIANELWRDRAGRTFEVTGISPDVSGAPFNPDRIISGYLDFVRAAIQLAMKSEE